MKYLIVVLSVVLISCSGCIKEDKACTNVKPESEEAQITTYAAANGLTVTKHSSGLYYQIVNAGTGVSPSLSSRVFITYTGKLLNGTVFDQQANSTNTGWALRELIEGWQLGLPLIKKGGTIKLIVPSALAYGCNGSPNAIPSNAVLYFEINLVDVQ